MRRDVVKWVAALLVGLAFFLIWTSQVTSRPVMDDALQTLRMAVNLERHGVMSLDKTAPYRPSYFREPLPVWASALAIRGIDTVFGEAGPNAYYGGERLRY